MSYVKDLTGLGITESVSLVSTDLGIPRWDAERDCWCLLFGDSWRYGFNRGEWLSPVIMCYDKEFNPIGVPTENGVETVLAQQLWEYPHRNPEFSTVLPTDFIKIGQWWYVHVMVTQGLGNEKWTEFQRSRDLVHWEHTGRYCSPADPIGTMLTFEQIDEWVYIFGTGGLRRDKPVFLWRALADAFPHGSWEPWGWKPEVGWRWGLDATPVLPGQYGELCFRKYGEWCYLSFFDAANYEVACLETYAPTDDLHTAPRKVIATGQDFPQLYGGYSFDPEHFVISQWNTATNDPYKSMLFRRETVP